MFQCKAHLVMRLIENRISMEFMLQVSIEVKNLTVVKRGLFRKCVTRILFSKQGQSIWVCEVEFCPSLAVGPLGPVVVVSSDTEEVSVLDPFSRGVLQREN